MIKLNHIFLISLLLNGLASMSIATIPIPTLGMLLTITASLFFFKKTIDYPTRKILFLLGLFVVLTFILNIFYWPKYSVLHPLGATASYSIYITLRYLTILSFLAITFVTLRLCRTNHKQQIINITVTLGIIASMYAIYVYFAQIFNLPELLPRSRIGTGGEEQSISFSYAFHRAVGSFREPSHLAEWLIVPFVLSFFTSKKMLNWRPMLIGGVILLTGSMSGIISLLIGFVLAGSLTFLHISDIRITRHKLLTISIYIILISMTLLGVNYTLNDLLFETIINRSDTIIFDGIKHSNRGYIYEYTTSLPFPLIGVGFGNAQIEFSNVTGSNLINSFLSLYLNIFYNTGILGGIIFTIAMIYPLLWIVIKKRDKKSSSFVFFIVWGYIAWLVNFSVNSEEPSIMFGLIYGILISNIDNMKSLNHKKSE